MTATGEDIKVDGDNVLALASGVACLFSVVVVLTAALLLGIGFLDVAAATTVAAAVAAATISLIHISPLLPPLLLLPLLPLLLLLLLRLLLLLPPLRTYVPFFGTFCPLAVIVDATVVVEVVVVVAAAAAASVVDETEKLLRAYVLGICFRELAALKVRKGDSVRADSPTSLPPVVLLLVLLLWLGLKTAIVFAVAAAAFFLYFRNAARVVVVVIAVIKPVPQSEILLSCINWLTSSSLDGVASNLSPLPTLLPLPLPLP